MSTPIAHALPLIVLCAGSDASQVGDVEGVEATPPAPEGARFRLRPLLLAVPNPHANPRDRPGTWNSQSGQDRTVHALMPSDGMGNRHRFFIDLAAKPQWFLDLVNDYGAKAETPCVLLPGGEFVTDTAKVLARLAPYDGVGMAVEPADVSPGMLMAWFGYQASVPVAVGAESHESRRWRAGGANACSTIHFHAGHGAGPAWK